MQSFDGNIRLTATDLANHLACRHLTQLDRRAAAGELVRPVRYDPVLETLVERGQDHERAYVEHLQSADTKVIDVRDCDEQQAHQHTIAAMAAGVDVIVQGVLANDRWYGRPDLLLRVTTASRWGAWSYEVADTKLALGTRGGTILQLCLYSELLAEQQGSLPAAMYVVKPGEPFNVERLRILDYIAYYRKVKRALEVAALEVPAADIYPHPVAHCEICNWWSVCNGRRRDDDHLSFVAGIQKLHIGELSRQGITTLHGFATGDEPLREAPQRGSVAAFRRVHRQAQIQHRGRTTGQLAYEMLSLEPKRGFQLLPEPSPGDLFFDIEGDIHVRGGGLEYLLGFAWLEKKGGKPNYVARWALSRTNEKQAFEEFIDLVIARRRKHPGMHVYHYAPYEQVALKRLAMRHATREEEVDQLLRGNRLVDLYAVVRQGLRASVEGYSIKLLEAFYGYHRTADLESARRALHRIERALELDRTGEITDEVRQVVEAYNRDDCLSALALRSWLEQRRQDLVDGGHQVPRPGSQDGAASDDIQQRNEEVAAVFDRLVEGLPAEGRTEDENARWLLAHLLDYFRREDRCVWWEYFRLQGLEQDELVNEKDALTGLRYECELPLEGRARTPTHRYRFPLQETQIGDGDCLVEVGGEAVGTVAYIDVHSGILDIKKRGDAVDRHPNAVFSFTRIKPAPLPESLLSFARLVADHVVQRPPRDARYSLLAKQRPRFKKRNLLPAIATADVAAQLALDLDQSVLPIQGPPGAGKTYTGSQMICQLAKAGKRIGVTAVSHKVIAHLLNEVYVRTGGRLRVAHKISGLFPGYPSDVEVLESNDEALQALEEGMVVGGTAWLWARPDAEGKLDYLFVDEAGQTSLALTLAAGRAARNLVLLGDPRQLEQPQQGAHPEGAEVAALSHLLDGHDTLPADRGLFLEDTWRLHPKLCQFTSELYYEGRLRSRPGLERQAILGSSPFSGAGLAYVPVVHEGNQNRSVEEGKVVRSIFEMLLDGGHAWRNNKEETFPLAVSDILVVAPYNAQVDLLQSVLPEGARVGTVDKFQGQQAPVVIYSLASSSVDDAPRGMEFLYNANRMNVATSRARCRVVLVASPELFQPECMTPVQIRLANGFCRFMEMADLIVVDVEPRQLPATGTQIADDLAARGYNGP